ncbi:hypothetical protein ES703_37418 [subsurface metagenome]
MSDNKINTQTVIIAVVISVILSIGISFVISPSSQGSKGPQGLQGEPGPQGARGETGPRGATGNSGPQGEKGIQGQTGSRGSQGEQGPPGESYTYEEFLEYVSEELETVLTFSGATDRSTNLFYVPTNQIKISWDLDPGQISLFIITLYEEGDTYSLTSWSSLEDQPQGDTYAYISPGYYYLKFSVVNCEYTVTVETVNR